MSTSELIKTNVRNPRTLMEPVGLVCTCTRQAAADQTVCQNREESEQESLCGTGVLRSTCVDVQEGVSNNTVVFIRCVFANDRG